MSIDLYSDVPSYRQLADLLRAGIEDGTYKAGDQLPSIRELQRQYGLAPGTIRSAVKLLVDAGLVVNSPGRGAFVRPRHGKR